MVAIQQPKLNRFTREEHTMATAKTAPAKKAPRNAGPAKKAAPKASAAKSEEFSLKDSAEKALNIYLLRRAWPERARS